MRLDLILIGICSVFIVHEVQVFGEEWEEDDAIVIENDIYSRKAEVEENGDSTSNPVTGQEGTVVSVEVVPGKCTKFKDCYPILYFVDEEEALPTITSAALRDFILSTSSPCELSQAPNADSQKPAEDELYIWCPQRNFSPPKQKFTGIEISSEEATNTNSQEAPTTTFPPPFPCGPNKKTLDNRVVGGREALISEFPWSVAVLNKAKQFCGGSLISDQFVLLAAHCVSHLKKRHLQRLRVLIGDHDIRDPTDVDHQERNVSKVIYHRGFNMNTIHNDIALIKLSEPVTFAENVVPICLPTTNYTFEDGKTHADVSGYGQIYDRGPQPTKLRTANIKVWTRQNCIRKYRGKAPGGITAQMFCAGSKDPKTKDVCRGDSGSALTLPQGDHVEQIGLVSWGIGCGSYPGVYTRIHSYLDWIKKYSSS